MGLVKELGKNLVGIGFALGITAGALTGINYYENQNVNYNVNGKKVFQKIDGVLAHTQIEINNDNSIAINRYTPLGSKIYTDTNRDGKIDELFESYGLINRGPDYRIFDKKDLLKKPEILKKANQDFIKQLKRFDLEDYLKEHKKNDLDKWF